MTEKPMAHLTKPSPHATISKPGNTHSPIEDTQEEKNIYDDILKSSSELFDQNMILLVKNAILRPWRWDKSWTKQSSTQTMIILNKPSIFQIVYKTKQKYHGYVVVNDINDAFFKTWNEGRYPEHVTILPLIKNKSIKGMLLGATSTKKGELLSLDPFRYSCLRSF